ncbi:MAG: 50S ribosomal protein L13 [Deltaproteobacteria bacterium]|nr:50S ribosomal protein L13 [Deltaproteobacteria bacterium]
MKTTITNEANVTRHWYIIDAKDQTVGRLATRIAVVLRGKHKPTFSPHVDGGDYIVVINAAHLRLTGKKMDTKQYHQYSGYPGGLRSQTARELLATYPDRVLTSAVKGMLPKNRLSRQVIKKLKIYGGAEHPHDGQQPQPFPSYVK